MLLKNYCFALPKIVRQEFEGKMGGHISLFVFSGVKFVQDIVYQRLFKIDRL